MSDLISRADAIEAVCEECSERWKHYKECDLYKDGQCFEITALMALPSAEAVKGEWQKVEEQPYFRKHYDTVCCSVCRKKGDRKWNFCPNCGARMKGGAE